MIQILYARDRVPAPWKNGGGTTTEVAIFPPAATLDAFDWRVSIADVEHSGPFSLFPGIDRQLAMLKGRVSLAIAGRDTVEISASDPPVAFPGDVATAARVMDGPATDLNVMTRRQIFRASITGRELAGAVAIDPLAQTTLLFMLAATTVAFGPEGVSLERGDALLATEAAMFSFPVPSTSYWIEIFPAGK